ncbi:MAG: single-stranded-DNA-specific exonuclease RecJ, partial [Leptolyngbyaceae cyanobacterium bins.59]|nr:single-stranded-DNA-specific exonuclease RecJ [Leptolyngbyaceae cyanobacterium bins.59]
MPNPSSPLTNQPATVGRSRSTRPMPDQRWQIASPLPDRVAQISESTGLSPLLAQVLMNRGMDTPETSQVFLNPDLLALPAPLEEFPDLAISVELLYDAILTQQKIAICGDYDADGMTSTALLLRALRGLGAIVDYAIPSRMQEGYGINQRIVEEFYDEGIGLILTVDNGISAYHPIARAKELGMAVIITDHHDLPPELPPADAILNPKLIAETSPYRGVAGVGVAYILALALADQMGKAAGLANTLLELFTLGTIADLAPLTGVNRAWVKRGLSLLPKSKLAGVQALIQMSGLSGNKTLKPEAIGFTLGPRINAVGRIANPQIVIELLTTDDGGIALERAMQCEDINRERQRLCQQIEREAIDLFEQSSLDLHQERVLVLVKAGWHHGVIGIVASRLLERYGVPVFIVTYEEESEQHIRGSARGIPEFNVFEALEASRDLLEKFGGHKAAGGFSLKAENLAAFRARLREFAHTCLNIEHLKPLLRVDAQADLSQLTLMLYEQIDRLHPCGIENPDPVFWTPQVRVLEQRAIGQGQTHLKLTLSQTVGGQASTLKAVAWRWGEFFPLPSLLDVAYKLRLNEWNGERTVELELVGARLPVRPEAGDRTEFIHNARSY